MRILHTKLYNALMVLGAVACPLIVARADIFPTPLVVCDRFANMYGPIHIMGEMSTRFGLVIDPKYTNSIGPYDAMSFEFAFGGAEFRGAISWGHAISEDTFIKATAEYFAEEPDYHFTGIVMGGNAEVTHPEWVGQADFGFDFNQKIHWLNGIESYHVTLQYTTAESFLLASAPILPPGNFSHRAIEGDRDYGIIAGLRVSPWMDAAFDLDINYDILERRRNLGNLGMYKDVVSSSGIGGTAAFHQLIDGQWKVDLRVTNRLPYYEYYAGLSYLTLNVAPGSRLEVTAHASLSGGDVPEFHDFRYGLGIDYTLGGSRYASARNDYRSDIGQGLTREVVEYTNIPAVRPPQIQAIAEEVLGP